PVIYNMGCDDWYFSSNVNLCAFGQTKNARHTAVIMGDSVGLQWFPAIGEVFNRKDWRLLVITKSSCSMLDQPLFYPRIGRVYTECSVWRKHATEILKKMKPDIVILGSTYTYKFTKNQWISGTRDLLSQISPFAKHVYILRSTPTIPFDGPTCLAPRSWLYRLLARKNRCVAPAHNARFDDVYAWRELAASHFPNVTSVDMTDAVCPEGKCQAQRNGVIVFRDSRHMTATFTRTLGKRLAKQLQMSSDD
ncbi:MAG TPA: SGNH hydrolase domain-containing protein, partial [Limnobacter sp.]|uniref:SGNH hydrolase domain-containing protein n=1 Tax=Limnobacter sp. TaxID=2003368 RepID=UPI002E2EE900